MEPLPFIDEYARPVDAPAEVVWGALLDVLRRSLRSRERVAWLLGCEPREGTAAFSGRPGEAVPGFRVVEAEASRRLLLRGRHRFADYSLTFVLDGGSLRAATHGAFPGALGKLYRAAVIGSGGHRLVAKTMLRQVARVAERRGRPLSGGGMDS